MHSTYLLVLSFDLPLYQMSAFYDVHEFLADSQVSLAYLLIVQRVVEADSPVGSIKHSVYLRKFCSMFRIAVI